MELFEKTLKAHEYCEEDDVMLYACTDGKELHTSVCASVECGYASVSIDAKELYEELKEFFENGEYQKLKEKVVQLGNEIKGE